MIFRENMQQDQHVAHFNRQKAWQRIGAEMGVPIELIKEAALHRCAPREWLHRMKNHLDNGELTPEQLREIADRFGRIMMPSKETERLTSLDFTLWLKKAHPAIKDWYTNLGYNARWHVFDESLRSLGGKWMDGFSLDGLTLDTVGGSEIFRGIDLSGTQIRYAYHEEQYEHAKQEGVEKFDLYENALEIPDATEWGFGSGAVETCLKAERRFEPVLRGGGSGTDEYPFAGLIFLEEDAEGKPRPVGLMKFDGRKSMLELRTVSKGDRTTFKKGMISAFDPELFELIKQKLKEKSQVEGHTKAGAYGRFLHVSCRELKDICEAQNIDFSKGNMRFMHPAIVEDDNRYPTWPHGMYNLMSDFVHWYEKGELTSQPLLNSDAKL